MCLSLVDIGEVLLAGDAFHFRLFSRLLAALEVVGVLLCFHLHVVVHVDCFLITDVVYFEPPFPFEVGEEEGVSEGQLVR